LKYVTERLKDSALNYQLTVQRNWKDDHRRRIGMDSEGDGRDLFEYTRLYQKVSGLAAWNENCKWYSSLPLGAVVSLFSESV